MRFIRFEWKRVQAGVLTVALLLAFAPAVASADEMGGGGFAVPQSMGSGGESMRYHAGYGAAAVVASVIYGPTKCALAIVGAVAGGVAYVFTLGDEATARSVAGPALMGDYVVTPAHVKGDRQIEFFGAGNY